MTRIYGKGQDHDGVKWEVTESHLPVPVVHISTADWLNVGGLHLTVAQAKQFVTAIQEAMADAVTGGLHEHLVGAACEFCGDQGPLLLQSVCHLTAPLQAILECGVSWPDAGKGPRGDHKLGSPYWPAVPVADAVEVVR